MKYRANKVLRFISSFISTSVGVAGLILTILAYYGMDEITNNSIAVWVILIFGNGLLFILGIYLSVSFIKNQKMIMDNEEYKSIAKGYKSSQKIVLENQKQIITNYKELSDRLEQRYSKYKDRLKETERELEIIKDNFINATNLQAWEQYKKDYWENTRKAETNQFTDDIIDNYQRFMGNITILLRRSVEEYFNAKGCREDVSVAVKQLDTSILYSKLSEGIYKDNGITVYTAFRDSRTYFNKERQETWKNTYKIHKNSAFLNCIGRGYYIFNYFDKDLLEDGVYLNENIVFYDQYNCGVTSSIYSCVNGERKLFGYLACDSLVNVKKKRKVGSIYDWNTAIMTMYAANIIALYLQDFEKIWNQVHKEANFCIYMVDKVKRTRYDD